MTSRVFYSQALRGCLSLALALLGIANCQAAGLPSRAPDQEGLNERVWIISDSGAFDQGAASTEVNPSADIANEPSAGRPKGRVMEMATGMNYFDGDQLRPSVAAFTEGATAFIANQTQHKVSLRRNIFAQKAVTVTSRDGVSLNATPAAIYLYDTESGVSLLIGTVTDSVGVLVRSNRVVYPNAFKGVCADVVYTIGRATFEQDVVIAERLDPAEYGFAPETTQVQIFSEIFDLQGEPERVRRPIRVEEDLTKRQRMDSPDLVDEVLGFGEVVLSTGRATTVEKMAGSDYGGVPVGKKLVSVGGRRFLVESVDYSALQQEFMDLPECNADNAALDRPRRRGSEKGYVGVPTIPEESSSDSRRATQVASLDPATLVRTRGVVVDFLATIGSSLSSGFVFNSDTTHLVTGAVICNGSVTIEGGAVVKYRRNTPANASINIGGAFSCKTSTYRPAFFTAVDDDSVGETMNGYPNSGYVGPSSMYTDGYANPALWFSYAGSQVLKHLRFRYCQEAVRFEGPIANYEIWHSQWVKCIRGIVITGSGSGSVGTTSVNNNLFADVHYPLTVGSTSCSQAFYNCTVNNTDSTVGTTLISSTVSATCTFYNSLLVKITSINSGTVSLSASDYNGFYLTTLFGGSVNRWTATAHPFVVGFSGKNYLPGGGLFADKGTTGVLPSGLATDLAKLTTLAPMTLPASISAATTLNRSVGVARDGGAFDLGYHYSAIDWVLNQSALSARLTVTNGAAIGLLGNYGVSILSGGGVTCEGLPTDLGVVASLSNVQEQPTDVFNGKFISHSSGSAVPEMKFRFSDFSVGQGRSGVLVDTGSSGGSPFAYLVFKDSRLRNALLNLQPVVTSSVRVALTNCLIERGNITLARSGASAGTPLSVYLYNNSFINDASSTTPGTPPGLSLSYDTGTSNPGWEIRDNLFNKASQSMTGSGIANIARAYNAFTTGTANSIPGTVGDQSGFSVTYVTGPLGDYYLPSSATQLLDKDTARSPATAGLYHHTTRTTAGSKELSTALDIGFHYVGTTAAGQPLDTDTDALADVYEDRSGDAAYGLGDPSNWQSSDTDGDGMPDGWEYTYGFSLVADDASGDGDNDGLSNRWEYHLGLDPKTDQSQNPADRRNYTYDLLNRLRIGTGRSQINATLDREGNIQQATP